MVDRESEEWVGRHHQGGDQVVCKTRPDHNMLIPQLSVINKTIGDEGITVDFRFIKVHTSNWQNCTTPPVWMEFG